MGGGSSPGTCLAGGFLHVKARVSHRPEFLRCPLECVCCSATRFPIIMTLAQQSRDLSSTFFLKAHFPWHQSLFSHPACACATVL